MKKRKSGVFSKVVIITIVLAVAAVGCLMGSRYMTEKKATRLEEMQAEVIAAKKLSDVPSATYAYYHAHIKLAGKKPAAPSAGKVWVCSICGYTYDEAKEGVPFESLPEDWVCPLCKHPKSDFVLQE